jgi:serine/threonine-protein kinase SRPK3
MECMTPGVFMEVNKRTIHRVMHISDGISADLRSANLLFKITGKLQEWSNEDVYINLGQPNTSEVERLDGQPTGHCAPTEVVQPIHTTKFMEAGLVDWENIVVVDFGQSFITHERPPTYMPATAVHYQAPETLFDQEFTAATDVWSLGCLLFEIRAGFPLFDPIMYANETSILIQNVNMLGKLPEPWWTAFTDCVEYFEENGDPKDPKHRTSIHDKLRRIGTQDTIPRRKDQEDGPMFEIRGTRLAEEEVELLGDLLGRMVTYRPEERMPMEDVIRHPWFSFQSADVLK